MKCFKTRIAPTPSGYLHTGNAFSFLLTQALAQRTGAEVMLRIDDMDRQRYRPVYVDDIFQTLRFLTISWQQGPADRTAFEKTWSQRHRMPLYDKALKALRDAGFVFACTCSRAGIGDQPCSCVEKNLPLDAPDAAWRLKTDTYETIAVLDVAGRTMPATLPGPLRNFVVRRKDGLPAYQLTSVVDDLHFGIDLVVRGADLWPSSIAQHVLAQRLGAHEFAKMRFYHHPLLQDAAGQKLSKSAGAASLRQWRSNGYGVGDLIMHIGDLLHCPETVRTGSDLLACSGI